MRKLRKRSEADQGSLKAFATCTCVCTECACICPVMTYNSTYYGEMSIRRDGNSLQIFLAFN